MQLQGRLRSGNHPQHWTRRLAGCALGRIRVGCGFRCLDRSSALCHQFGPTQCFILLGRNEFLEFLPHSQAVSLDYTTSNSPACSVSPLFSLEFELCLLLFAQKGRCLGSSKCHPAASCLACQNTAAAFNLPEAGGWRLEAPSVLAPVGG